MITKLNDNCMFIRGKTNTGEFGKQYFSVHKEQGTDDALIVRKLVYSQDMKFLNFGYKPLKSFRGKFLFEIYFSIKIKTFSEVAQWLNNLQ